MFAPKPPSELRPPATVLAIVNDLEKAGFQAWCVGGAVRDALVGHASTDVAAKGRYVELDWDLATDATPDQVRSIFGRKRTIPVGIEFGTVGILDEAGVLHEVTTFRRDVRTDGRHAEVEFGASLDEDLARRDFTVNAIAYSPSRRQLHDPFGGQADIQARVIRAVGDPAARMREDRLRALRAIRFAARFDFEIDPKTLDAIRESAAYLTRLSAERVRQEIEKTMEQVAAPSEALRMWISTGAAGVLVPELVEGEAGISDEALKALDCSAQPGLSRRPGRKLARVAVLFSDVPSGKVFELTTRLRFSRQEAQWIASIVQRWQGVGAAMAEQLAQGEPDAKRVRRWIAAIGRPQLSAFFRLASARWAVRRAEGKQPAPAARAVHSLYRRSIRAALSEPVDLRDLAVDGDDLRQAGITPGPELGKILSALLELVLEDPTMNVRERLMAEARRLQLPKT